MSQIDHVRVCVHTCTPTHTHAHKQSNLQEMNMQDAAVFEGVVQLPPTPPLPPPTPDFEECPAPEEMGGEAALRLLGRVGLSEVGVVWVWVWCGWVGGVPD